MIVTETPPVANAKAKNAACLAPIGTSTTENFTPSVDSTEVNLKDFKTKYFPSIVS